MTQRVMLLALVLIATPSCARQPEQPESAAHDSAVAGQGEQAAAAAAEAGAAAGLPAGWQVRLDHPDRGTAGLEFVAMPPGWHVITGPAGVYWQPSMRAEGDFALSATISLFKSSGAREGYGLFAGGDNLEQGNEAQSYTYFLLRGDGNYLIKKRNGAATETVRDWTASPAVAQLPTGDEPARNILAIEALGDVVNFYVNGQKVETVQRAQLDVDGLAGLRVNHRLNLHVSDLTLAEKLGPGR